jgi:O-antigen/teichoic acid export membrane protein
LLARKATLVIVNDVIGSVLGLVALFFIARELNSHVLGMIGFGLAFVQLYGIVTNLGYSKAHVKRVSEGQDLGKCVGTYLAIKLVLLLAFNVVLFGSLFIWTDVMGRGFESQYHLNVIYIMALYFNLEAMTRFFITTFTGRLEIAKAQVPRILGNTIRLVGTIYFAITITSGHEKMYDAAIPLAWMYVLGGAVQLVVALYFFRGYPISRPSKDIFMSYTKYAIPAIIMTSMVVITVNIDKVMIQAFWSSRHTGLYTAAQRIAFVIVFLTNAIGSVILPSISRHHSKGERSEVRKLMNRAERYIIMIALPPIVMFFTLPHRIINILSGQFMGAVPILQILSIWALITVVNTPYRNLIQGFDRPDIMAKVSILQASLNIMLNLVFIPAALFGVTLFGWSAIGAAVATLITQIVLFIVVRWHAYRLSGAVSSLSNALLVVGGVAMALALLTLDNAVPAVRWYHLMAYGLIGIGVYIGVLVVIGQFTRNDLGFFLQALNPREMFSYVKTEITTRGADDDPGTGSGDEMTEREDEPAPDDIRSKGGGEGPPGGKPISRRSGRKRRKVR